MSKPYTESRKRRLAKIRGTTARVEAMLLELKRLTDDDFFRNELNNVFGDLYYLRNLAGKAP